MAKNKSKSPKGKDNADYYKLNTDAVNRLVDAEKNALKELPLKDPAKQYRSDFLDRIPSPVKALFIKWWFSGSICFFLLWTISFIDFLDMIVVMSIVIGMITDILINNILRFIEVVPGENSKWMMFTKKKYWTFFANIFYSALVFYCVVWFYNTVNVIINSATGNSYAVEFGVDPIIFGIIYLAFDLLFIGMKNLMKSIVNDAKNKVNKQ